MMMGLFTRRRTPAADTSGLGLSLIAQRLGQGDAAPAASTVVVFNPAGHARRMAAGRVACNQGEIAYCFHPGPYSVDLLPFAAAPEIGLRLRFVIDAANPRVTQQRFDLYLFSEADGQLTVSAMGAALEQALQAALAQGGPDLPPCTSLDEWNVFRAGLNQLLYTRFGITVDDCVPVDLGDDVDYAAILRKRAASAVASDAVAILAAEALVAETLAAEAEERADGGSAAATVAAPPPVASGSAGEGDGATASRAARDSSNLRREPTAAAPLAGDIAQAAAFAGAAPSGGTVPGHGERADRNAVGHADRAAVDHAERDARALRRLFLELPALSGALRLLVLPPGLDIFQSQQALLQRLGLLCLSVASMPSLAWAAPDRPLAAPQQRRRSDHSLAAVGALDEGWSLLARLQLANAARWPQLLEEADRICANLEFHLELRRAPCAADVRKEPSL